MDRDGEIKKEVIHQLRRVIDPELGVNVVDLGLIYNIQIEEDKLLVEYTTTTPGCPLRRYLKQQMEQNLEAIEGLTRFEYRLVMEPEWSVDMVIPNIEFFSSPPPHT